MTNMSANKQKQQTDTKLLINETEANYLEICRQLNMDKDTERAAWQSYLEISQNCTLQGEQNHWLCCSIYAACRESYTPTVDSRAVVAGNCISLTKLLRSCNISINDFCTKIKIWVDIRNLSNSLRTQIDRLEQSFHVSYFIYQKFEKLFLDLFVISSTERKKKKAKPGRCSASKLYDFCWCLFIAAKGEEPKYRTDLVTSLHLLLCCVDLIFVNAVLDDRRDIINPEFVGLPKEWNCDDFDPSKLKNEYSILRELCPRVLAEYVEVENLRRTTWKIILGKLIKHKTLHCNSPVDLNVTSNAHFEPNLKSLNNSYEQYILSVGEFDERIFLNSDKERHLQSNSYMPGTPVSRMAAVQCLENIVAKGIPKDFIELVGPEMLNKLESRLDRMNELFLEKCPKLELLTSEDIFKNARVLYFDLLGKIIHNEIRIKPQLDVQIILDNSILQETLIVCCVEIVNIAYEAKLAFPWVLDCFKLNSYNFYKIIEIVVQRHENVLDRPTINHLDTIEGMCLDHLNWKDGSELWNAIKKHKEHAEPLPTYEQVDHRNANANISASCRKMEDSGLRFFQSPSTGINHQITTEVAESARRNLFNAEQSRRSNRDADKPTEVSPPKPRVGSIHLFLRKFYELSYNRITRLCEGLNMMNNGYPQMIWTLFEYCIINKTEIMRDRHLDQIIMCTIYVLIKVKDIPNRNFTEIMQVLRQVRKATSSIYRQVLLTTKDGKPTYGDIIQFYNSVYVQSMSPFALNFADKNKQEKNLLSPHPPDRLQSPMKIPSYPVYVQPLDKKDIPISPKYITFEFNRSPSKDLIRINEKICGKRGAQEDQNYLPKRVRDRNTTGVEKKIQGIIRDRREN